MNEDLGNDHLRKVLFGEALVGEIAHDAQYAGKYIYGRPVIYGPTGWAKLFIYVFHIQFKFESAYILTASPSLSSWKPVTMTLSPAFRPETTSALPSDVLPLLMSVLFAFPFTATYTYSLVSDL